jgi:hypothetical protein
MGGVGKARVILLLFYAVFTWYLAVSWRRTWKGFASQAASVIFIVGIIQLLRLLDSEDADQAGRFMSIQVVLVFEAGVVALVGCIICCLPRPMPSPWHCHHCGYDLSGSTGVSPRSLSGSMPEQSLPEQPAPEQPSLMVTCPECGTSCSLQREKPEELIPIPTGKARPIGRRRGPGL